MMSLVIILLVPCTFGFVLQNNSIRIRQVYQPPAPLWLSHRSSTLEQYQEHDDEETTLSTKQLVTASDMTTKRSKFIRDAVAVTLGLSLLPSSVHAADLQQQQQQQPKEFVDLGTQAPAPQGEKEFVQLSNGVKFKDMRPGSGEEVVKADSQVMIQVSGRLLNLNGVSFYNTKNNNPDGFGAVPLTIRLGQGEAVPGLEAGVIGMKKGGIRRIIVPPDLAYSKYPNLEPRPMTANDQRALDSVVKNPRRDATILFDVALERFK
mmetsp:Transcript_15292/g.28788  ORF Transcript_15292/g.28788 Transcript_15292/m.28788 type:complete len:263 (+) Transcript_15292:187-975(+)|eukprot:CAMPEP_0176494552 /NCGR_PEP_ID=MMETSP0200_2-20121128/10168_1 /TAXON_ID=947934 /ORGANISM="Chaetoceros sp., Strain GSL56" /LENGTH=262 /DNA_ID=CAMNT_0017892339 /DNA_START=147 /DNA_END=935 /DNA_ORIENTATION=+